MRFEVFAVPGIPEVQCDDSIASLIMTAMSPSSPLQDGDIVTVTSKIVSKAEGRVRQGSDREAAIDAEAVRTVAEWATPRGRTRIVETRHGLVLAAAGVDASNVETGHVVLLPIDPDESARGIRSGLMQFGGVNAGVIITDTVGRVWRQGVTDIAIGAAGVQVVDDLRGQYDSYGNELGVTLVALADEIAAASELVRRKLDTVPVAVVRGLSRLVLPSGDDGAGAKLLVRPAAEDRFRLGTPEAMRAAVVTRRTVREFTDQPVAREIVDTAIQAAATGPAFGPESPVSRFAIVESDAERKALGESLPDESDLVMHAPAVIVPCVMSVHGDTAAIELGAAVENLLISLAAEGIGSEWLRPDIRPALDRLPPGWTPFGAIVAGHAS